MGHLAQKSNTVLSSLAIVNFVGMDKLHIGQRIELKITDYAFGGKGISKLITDKGDKIIFVQNAIPGQRVLARVVKTKKRYSECKLVKVLQRAPEEQDTSFHDIPGAPYAHLPISNQKELKQDSAFGLYRRIGKIENIEDLFDTWIDAPEPWHYRNKMEYSFSAINSDPLTDTESDRFSLGFKRRGSWWAVENLNGDSGLFDAEFESNIKDLRRYFINTGLPAWNPRKREGYYKNLTVRKSFFQDKLLINLITGISDESAFDAQAFVDYCRELFGDRIGGIYHSINKSTGDRSSIEDELMTLLYGEPVLIEKMHGLEFEIGMRSFFQPNPRCAEKLYAQALDYVTTGSEISKSGTLLDLFCGTGTLAQLLAQKYPEHHIVGVDIEPSAIEDASRNAKRNGIDKLEFVAGDVGQFLFQHPELKGKIAAALLDPPRAGIAPKTLRKVIRLEAQKLVYISCNPATQARDCEALAEAGYQLKKLSFADQFPHTSHVEAVGLFEKMN